MLEIKNVKIYDLYESIIASGYAMMTDYDEDVIASKINGFDCSDDNKDYKRIKKLVEASANSQNVKCHDKFLTGIRVSFDIIYPNYISPEMQRYHWYDIVTSSSKMHRLLKMDFDKSCNKYVTQETKDNMKKYIKEYNDLFEGDKKAYTEDAYKAFMKVLSNCPLGLELFMRVSTNYKQLQTMYHQRKNHRLKEDWGAFCKFVEELPLADVLITGKEKENAN